MALLGIAGPSGSGKSSLALALVERLGRDAVTVIPLDVFYHDLADLAPSLRRHHNFDAPEAVDVTLMARQLEGLSQGRTVERPIYRFDTHTRAPRGTLVAARETVIVEGLFALYWPRIRDLLAMSVFVDVDDATALARRLQRDVAERGRSEASVRRQYEATVRPMYERHVRPTRDHADLVLDGTRPVEELVAAVVSRWEHRSDSR